MSRPSRPVEERFWEKVGDHSDFTRCWLWVASFSSSGAHHFDSLKYGRFWDGVREVKAHRFSYVLRFGSIPEGMTIDHVAARGCASTLCVNPYHLEVVTRKVNTLRGVVQVAAVNARKTCCKKGHPFNEENTYVNPDGKRKCRVCCRERQKICKEGVG